MQPCGCNPYISSGANAAKKGRHGSLGKWSDSKNNGGNEMRNYTQIDVEKEKEKEEIIKKRDIIGVIFAIAGVTILIWGLI
jgi:hypothetical protein